MDLKHNSNRAATIVEMIVVIVILSVVLLAAFSMMISQVQYLTIFRQESMLKGDNSYIIDRLKKIIMNSEHVDISGITTPPFNTENIQQGRRADRNYHVKCQYPDLHR